VSSTAWACLWLSDIDKLTELVDNAQRIPIAHQALLTHPKIEQNIVQRC